MRQRIHLTESQLYGLVEQALNELDWKTYMNAANKRMQQWTDDLDSAMDLSMDPYARKKVKATANKRYSSAMDLAAAAEKAFDKKHRHNYLLPHERWKFHPSSIRGWKPTMSKLTDIYVGKSKPNGEYDTMRYNSTAPDEWEVMDYLNDRYRYEDGKWRLNNESIAHRVTESVMRRLNEWGGEQSSLEMTIANAVDDDIDREGMADTGEHTVEVEYDVDNDDTVRGEVSFSLSYLKGTPTLSDFFVDLWIDYGEFHTGEDYNNYSLDDIVEILRNRGIVVQN